MKPDSEQRIRAALANLGDVLVEALDVEAENDGIERLLSVEEAAERLNVGRTTVYGQIADGSIRSVKVGRRRLIPASAIAEIGGGEDGR